MLEINEIKQNQQLRSQEPAPEPGAPERGAPGRAPGHDPRRLCGYVVSLSKREGRACAGAAEVTRTVSHLMMNISNFSENM